jgi:hypothetical protein
VNCRGHCSKGSDETGRTESGQINQFAMTVKRSATGANAWAMMVHGIGILPSRRWTAAAVHSPKSSAKQGGREMDASAYQRKEKAP